MRSSFAAAVSLSLAVCVGGACVAPGSGETDLPSGLLANDGCEGEAPACIMGCTTRAFLGRAECEMGTWHCGTGVRHDLCCDPVFAPQRCPEWGEQCRLAAEASDDAPSEGAPAPASRACAEGYTCVVSRTWPLPANDGEEGLCRLGDWSIPAPLGNCSRDDVLEGSRVFDLGPAAVKLEGVVQVEPICDGRRCDGDDPCCQHCMGSYLLDLAGPDEAPLTIALRTETVSCAGTNCGFTCAPLQPGRRYRIWGLWVPDESSATPGALYVAGSCAN